MGGGGQISLVNAKNLTISFICSSFALIFPDPGFLSPGSPCSRKTEVLKVLVLWQNTKSSSRAHRPLCNRMLPETLSSGKRRQPKKLTLERKAAGIAYLSFGGINLALRHFLRVKFKRSALHNVQEPAMFNPLSTKPLDVCLWTIVGTWVLSKNMASGSGIIRGVKGIFQKPVVKKAVKRIFPDPMDHFKYQDVLWDFREKKTLEEWTLVTDDQFGGKSTAEFVQSPSGRAVFKGNISTELPPATDAKYTGMCSIRAQPKRVSPLLCLGRWVQVCDVTDHWCMEVGAGGLSLQL